MSEDRSLKPSLGDYDEGSYPRPAEDNDADSEHSLDSHLEHTSLTLSNDELRAGDECICVICAQVLLDPLTLHCGHSFCQPCLAGLWDSKRREHAMRLMCPVCRQPWRNLPGINIQLRGLIERGQSALLSKRREATSAEEAALVADFVSARGSEQTRVRQEAQRPNPELRRVVTLLFILFGCAITIIVLMFCVLLWVWVGASGEFMRKPVSQWDNGDVLDWTVGLGDWARHANVTRLFQLQKVTGSSLLLLDDNSLTDFGIKSDFQKKSILYAIRELKAFEFNRPRDFQQFKAAYRRETLIITGLYKLWPRVTFVYIYFFDYHKIFLPLIQSHFDTVHVRESEDESDPSWENTEPSIAQLAVFFLEVLVVPHFVVGSVAWSWIGVNFWVCSAVLLHCATAMLREGRELTRMAKNFHLQNLRERLPLLARRLPVKCLNTYFLFVFVFFVATLVWHMTPHFVCDIAFYLLLWHNVYNSLLLLPVISWLRGRRERLQIRVQHNFGQRAAGVNFRVE